MNRLSLALVVALAASTLAMLPEIVTGCAAVPKHGHYVDTSEEAALIVWDEKSKTEHFIRRANFRSTGYDFGFLVPTPNRPDLDLADDDVFSNLASITAPRIEYQDVVEERAEEFAPGCSAKFAAESPAGMAPKSAKDARPGGVDVLEQKRIGDYDATVLRFRKGDGDTPERGAAELEKWLITHGYETPPAVKEWLTRYVKDEWCITAFKIAIPTPKNAKDGTNATPNPHAPRNDLRAEPIRMSFKTEKPFYPYREPATEPTARPEPRLLRVFFAAAARYEGKLGDGTKPWPGKTVWSGPVETARWTGILDDARLNLQKTGDKLPFEPPQASSLSVLTEFEDRSSPRPGTDEVYFERSADQQTLERTPIVITRTKVVRFTPWWHVAVYVGVPLALVLISLGAWRLFRRA
jgi:hypothetical protein